MHPFQFSELTYLTARLVGGNVLQEGFISASGTTTSVKDTTRPSLEAADYWNLGTMWIINDAGGAGAAPEWESKVIRDYDGAGTFTTDAFSAAPDTGDRYALCKRRYKKDILEQMVNQAIMELGPVARTDTSLTTADNQTEYTLPIGANPDLRQVWIQTNSDSNDNKWLLIPNWEIVHGDPSTGDTLRFDRQFTSGYTIRLDYNARHAQLFTDTDRLQEDIPIERVIYPAALYCVKFYQEKTRTKDFADHVRFLSSKVDEFSASKMIPMHSKQNKILFLNRYN